MIWLGYSLNVRLVRAANCDHDFKKKKMGKSILVLNGRGLA